MWLKIRPIERVVSMIKIACIGLVVLLCFTFSNGLLAQDPVAGTRDVEVGVVLIDIEDISSVHQNFIANFYLEFRWQDSSLAHEGTDSISRDLDDIWHPRLQLLIQQNLKETFPREVEIKPDGQVIYRQRVWGSFSQPLELEDFPFDRQRLEITLVEVKYGSLKVRYKVNPDSGISNSLSIPDWQVLGWGFEPAVVQLNKSVKQDSLVFHLDVKRYYSFFILKVIFPLMLIVAMSWLVFWIDPSMAASQISVSVTAMLTMIAYRFAIGGMVPKLPFMTHMDYFVMASTILVFLSLMEVVYTSYLSNNDRLVKARRIDFHARWIAPLIFALVVLETLYFRNWL